MAKREWIGNYSFYFEQFYTYKSEWISQRVDLGRCLGVNEAKEKAIICVIQDNRMINWNTAYICDGWGNKFYAKER